jgi:hypothetical protein
MRSLVDKLGTYLPRLKECWGFDCLYGTPDKVTPDDATFWHQRASKDPRPLYVYYGPSTLPQSVKLYLMARGKANGDGDQQVPPAAPLPNVHVSIAHYETFMASGQAVNVGSYIDATTDDLMGRAAPGAKPAKPKKPAKGDFVNQAAVNLKTNYVYPIPGEDGASRGELHYFISRAFLTSRIRNATFL